MAEDLKSKLAAINAAKAERAKKQEAEAKLNAEVGEAQEKAEKENTLRDKAKELEAKIGDAEQSAKEAEEAIQQAEGMLADGGLEAEELAAIEGIKAEALQKIDELNSVRTELAAVKLQIEELNAKPEAPVAVETDNMEDEKAPQSETAVAEKTPDTIISEKTAETEDNSIEKIGNDLEEKVKGIVVALKETPWKIKNYHVQSDLRQAIRLNEEDPKRWAHYLNTLVREPNVDNYVSEHGSQAKQKAKDLLAYDYYSTDAKTAAEFEAKQKAGTESWRPLYNSQTFKKEYNGRVEAEKPAPIKQEEELRKRRFEEFGKRYNMHREADLSKPSQSSNPEFALDESLKRAILEDRAKLFEIYVGMTPDQFDKKYPAPKSIKEVFIQGPITEMSLPDKSERNGYKEVGRRQLMEQWTKRQNEIHKATGEDMVKRGIVALKEYEADVKRTQQTPDYINDVTVIKEIQAQYGDKVREATGLQDQLRAAERAKK